MKQKELQLYAEVVLFMPVVFFGAYCRDNS